MREGICPSCDHDEIVEAVAYESGAGGHVALAVTHELYKVFGAVGFDSKQPYGRLRMYVCRRCGLTQWYADRPDEIPVDADHFTRLIKGDRGGPYR